MLPTIEDNRYFPFYDRIMPRSKDRQSFLATHVFFMGSDKGRGEFDNDRTGIPEIFGLFDLIPLSDALDRAKIDNPLSPDLKVKPAIPWKMDGKFAAQGVWFGYEQLLGEAVSLGISGTAMHVTSRIEFTLPQKISEKLDFVASDFFRLDRERRAMFEALGMCAPVWHDSGAGDLDVYARVSKFWEYQYRLRSLDLSGQFGLMLPTGKTRCIENPASLPFGGNNRLGLYGQLNIEAELREGFKLGLRSRLSKRKMKTSIERMPACDEHQLFAAIVGPAEIDPGVTFSFSLYLILEELREGLGAYARYHYVRHREDCWRDVRKDRTIPVFLKDVIEQSDWTAEYFTFNVFYDFGTMADDPDYVVRFETGFDISTDVFGSFDFSQTHRITVGVAINF